MMNQDETTSGRASAAPRPAGSFSILAGFALALAVIPCPMVSLLGGVLGVIALQRIKVSQGKLRGKRTSAAAAIVGCTLSLATTLALNYYANRISESNDKAMTQAIAHVIESASANRPGEVHQRFSRVAQLELRDEDIKAFGAHIREHYGRFQRFAIASSSERGVFNRQVDVAGVFIFDRAERIGSVRFDKAVTMNQSAPAFQMRSIIIEDAAVGNAQLPAKAHSATQPAP